MRLSPRCFALTGLGYVPPWEVNAGFVVGERTTLVVDTGPTALAARTILGYAETAKPTNRMIALNTERHFDHLGGNAVFRDRGIPVYGHPAIQREEHDGEAEIDAFNAAIPDRARRAAKEGRIFFAGTRVENPDREMASETSLDLGGVLAQVFPTPGHTPTNLSVFVPSEGVLFCGDCVVSGYSPNLSEGGPGEWVAWCGSLDKIEALRPRILVPGHGPVLQAGEVGPGIQRIREVLGEALADNHPTGDPCPERPLK